MGIILNGGRGPKRSANFRDAMRRSAERRRCPVCDRKSALVRDIDPDSGIRFVLCRYCGYAKTR